MGDRADGTGDLNGSDVSDCGLSPSDMRDMKKSWIANMDTVKEAILENRGFIWQQMVRCRFRWLDYSGCCSLSLLLLAELTVRVLFLTRLNCMSALCPLDAYV